MVLVAPPARAVVFTVNAVTDTNDASLNGTCADGSNQCSLRAAIQEANNTTTKDVIVFDIGTGQQTITPDSALPDLAQPVVLNGTTQEGYSGEPLIEISGDDAGDVNGLRLTASNSTIRGVAVTGYDALGDGGRSGLVVTGNNNVIRANYIGLDLDGASDAGNYWGMRITNGSFNVIGGARAAHRNVISGNQGTGLVIEGTASENDVVNNFIGTDASGVVKVSNGIGLNIYEAQANTIGPGNVIAGGHPIFGTLTIQGGDDNLVRGNLIGTDKTGTVDLSGSIGVEISNNGPLSPAEGNVIGGSAPSDRNVISGNSTGIDLIGPNNKIWGNYIGLAKDGKTPLPNDADGIRLSFFEIPASNNTIGGSKSGQGNRIAFNGGTGVSLEDTNMSGNRIWGNSIYSNGELGIDLKEDLVSPNDAGDADSGPNEMQNFPVVKQIIPFDGRTRIKGLLKSAPSSNYRIHVYSSPNIDATGFGEGATPLGSATVSTKPSGRGRWALSIDKILGSGLLVTATATDVGGSTSEFSAAKPVCTVLGTNQSQKLVGSPGKDVICAKGGKDRIFAGDGSDVLLGGRGNDKLFGEGGRDFLQGDKGSDRLDGGPKRDACRQGPGSGTEVSCER